MEDDTQEIKGFVLECGDSKFEVDKNFMSVSDFASEYVQLYDQSEEIVNLKIDKEIIQPDILAKIVDWVKAHNYQPPKIQQIRSKNLEKNLDNNKINIEFVKNIDPIKNADLIKKFYDAAVYLRIQNLIKLLAARVATNVFFVNNKDYSEILNRFGIQEDIKIEEQEQIYKDEPWTMEY